MFKSRTLKIVIIVVLALVIIYWGYGFLSGMTKSSDTVPALMTDTGSGLSATGLAVSLDPTQAQTAELLGILQDLSAVDLQSRTLLSNKIFKEQLQDFGKAVTDRPTGRRNPFAPLGAGNLGQAGANSSNSSTNQAISAPASGASGASSPAVNPLDLFSD